MRVKMEIVRLRAEAAPRPEVKTCTGSINVDGNKDIETY